MYHPSVESPGQSNGVVVPAQAGQPAPTMVALQPMPMQGEENQQSTLRLHSILSAFRRRWFVAICLGLFASSAAAAGVWFAIPDTYTAFAELFVDPQKRFLYSDQQMGERTEDLGVYKQTLSRYMTYPFVLNAALRKSEVAQSETIKAHQIDPVTWLADNLQINSPAEQFIRVSLTGKNPKDVATIVNEVVAAFQQEVVDQARNEKQKKTDEIKARRDGQNAKLERKKQELRDLEKRNNAANKEQADMRMSAQFQFQIGLREQLGKIDWEILNTQIEKELLKSKPEESESDETTDGEEVAAVPDIDIPVRVLEEALLQDPDYVEREKKIDYLERELELAEKRYRSNHSRIRDSKTELAAAKQEIEEYRKQRTPQLEQELIEKIQTEMERRATERTLAAEEARRLNGQAEPADPVAAADRSIATLKNKRTLLEEELNQLDLKTKDLSSNWVDREILAEETEKLKTEVEFLDQLVEKREVESEYEVTYPPIIVRRPAEAPKKPDQGKRIKLASVAGLGLFGLVVGGVVFIEYSARRLNSVNEVQSDLNLQVMSTIPLMPRWVNSDSGNSRNKRSEYWHSVLTESVDATRTLLLRHAHTNSTKAVMIASATGGEGKTTLSCHLATSLARAGREVLLIDGDIRRPSVHKVFDLKNKPGLCEVLTDKVDFPDALHPVQPGGLTVLTAGRVDADALRVLAQDKLGEMLSLAREQFDFIILDTSPILPVTDALLMSQFMDGVLFSIRRDVSRAAKVSSAVHRISMLGVNVLGAVAIGLDEGPSKTRYSYYHYGYGYGANPHAPAPPSA